MKNYVNILSVEAHSTVEAIVINRKLIAAIVDAKLRLEHTLAMKDYTQLREIRADVEAVNKVAVELYNGLFNEDNEEEDKKGEEQDEEEGDEQGDKTLLPRPVVTL